MIPVIEAVDENPTYFPTLTMMALQAVRFVPL